MAVSDEFAFIKRIQPVQLFHEESVIGIGDDAAIIAVEKEYEKVVCVDTMVENIHFSAKTMAPFDIGYKALAANISDIAAMGGIPLYYLVSITIPKRWREEDLVAIYEGMKKLGDHFKMDLIGGDTTSGNDLVLGVFVIGKVEKGKRLLRSNAKPGDVVFVSGTLGDSAGGLDYLLADSRLDNEAWTRLVDKHQRPFPQVELGRILVDFKRAALNDISDGLASELMEIAEASHVDIMIKKDTLPISSSLLQYKEEQALNWVLTGGEDFELVGTISDENWPKLREKCLASKIPITRIGVVQEGSGHVKLETAGDVRTLKKEGYNHFNRS